MSPPAKTSWRVHLHSNKCCLPACQRLKELTSQQCLLAMIDTSIWYTLIFSTLSTPNSRWKGILEALKITNINSFSKDCHESLCVSALSFSSYLPFTFFARNQYVMEKHVLLFPSFLHLKGCFNCPFKMSKARFCCCQFCFNAPSLKSSQVLISQ